MECLPENNKNYTVKAPVIKPNRKNVNMNLSSLSVLNTLKQQHSDVEYNLKFDYYFTEINRK